MRATTTRRLQPLLNSRKKVIDVSVVADTARMAGIIRLNGGARRSFAYLGGMDTQAIGTAGNWGSAAQGSMLAEQSGRIPLTDWPT